MTHEGFLLSLEHGLKFPCLIQHRSLWRRHIARDFWMSCINTYVPCSSWSDITWVLKSIMWACNCVCPCLQASLIFLKTSSLWSRRDTEPFCFMFSAWVVNLYMNMNEWKAFVSEACLSHANSNVSFAGRLHVSCSGYSVWCLLCAIAGKNIRGTKHKHLMVDHVKLFYSVSSATFQYLLLWFIP